MIIHHQSKISTKALLLKYWTPVFMYCLLIVYLSSQSSPEHHIPSAFFYLDDKILHAFEYGILGILLYRAFKQTTGTLGSIGLAMICVIAFGISDEVHQWFVPKRHADVWDLVADTFGATFLIIGWIFMTEKWPFRFTRRKKWVTKAPRRRG